MFRSSLIDYVNKYRENAAENQRAKTEKAPHNAGLWEKPGVEQLPYR